MKTLSSSSSSVGGGGMMGEEEGDNMMDMVMEVEEEGGGSSDPSSSTKEYGGNCTVCPFHHSDYDSLFRHGVETHGVYICVGCTNHFSNPTELMVHLFREHRVPSQQFRSEQEFLQGGGEETVLCCVECSRIFDLSDELVDGHQCVNNSKVIASGKRKGIIVKINRRGRGRPPGGGKVNTIHNSNNHSNNNNYAIKKSEREENQVSITIVPVKNQQSNYHQQMEEEEEEGDEEVKVNGINGFNGHFGSDEDGLLSPPLLKQQKMQPQLPPPPPLQQHSSVMDQTPISQRPRRALKKVTNDDFIFEEVGRRRSNSKGGRASFSGAQQQQQITNSPRKLIVKFENQNNNNNANFNPPPKLPHLKIKLENGYHHAYTPSLTDEVPFEKSPKFVPKEELEEETKFDPVLAEPDPVKRLFMLIQELCDKLSKDWPGPDTPGFTYMEKQDESAYELLLDVPLTEKLDEDILTEMVNQTSPNCLYCRQVKLIRVDKRQLAIHLFSKHSWTLKFSEDENRDLSGVKIEWYDFKHTVLKKVFASDSPVLFGYKDSLSLRLGELPCECLLCGYSVDAQKNLFVHWRKVHRGIAMKCALCHGKFLFAGALFSHLCFGTPNPVVKNEVDESLPSGGKHHSSIADGGDLQVLESKEDDGSADTIVLRYHCGICDDLHLPGFFNYVVHIRRDHSTCELCLETMTTQKELEHHMKKHKLNHFCWKCGVTYCAKPNFMTHLFWKHGSESKECSKCLKKKWPHIYHFCVAPQFFSCETCGFYFTKPKSLIVHRRLHTKEKLRKCPKTSCTETFVSKNSLDKHLRTVHNPEKKEITVTNPDSKPDDLKNEENPDNAAFVMDVTNAIESDCDKPVDRKETQSPNLEESKTEEHGDMDKPLSPADIKNSKLDESAPQESDTSKSSSSFEEVPSLNESKTEESDSSRISSQGQGVQSENLDDTKNQDCDTSADSIKSAEIQTLVESKTEGSDHKELFSAKQTASVEELKTEDVDSIIKEAPITESVEELKTEDVDSIIKEAPITESVEELKTEDVDSIIKEAPITESVEELKTEGLESITKEAPVTEDELEMVESDNSKLSCHEQQGEGPVPIESESKAEESNTYQLPKPEDVAVYTNELPNQEEMAINLEESKPEESETSFVSRLGELGTNLSDSISIIDESDISKLSNFGELGANLDEAKTKVSDSGTPFNLEAIQGPNLSEDESDGDSSLDVFDTLGVSMDLDPIPKSESSVEDFGPMSPLLTPLDDFNLNLNVPDIPTFEDSSLPEHIIRENALFSLRNEHDYCLRTALKRGPSSSPRKGDSRHKKLKANRSPRKRHRSSSSSSSCSSSCGSNCSCSSSSSSSSGSSESEEEPDIRRPSLSMKISLLPQPPVPIPIPEPNTGPPVKRGRGRPRGSINRNKYGIPTAKKYWAHNAAGKRIGPVIVSKLPRPLNPDGTPMKRKYKKQKGKFTRKPSTAYQSEKQNDDTDSTTVRQENFLSESELDTDDSGSEEVYDKKQLCEPIGQVPAFDEIWTMPNDQYLLKILRGGKSVKGKATVVPM